MTEELIYLVILAQAFPESPMLVEESARLAGVASLVRSRGKPRASSAMFIRSLKICQNLLVSA